MDLWIRSQNGERLGIIQYIEYAKDDYGHHLIGWSDKFEGTKIATYKTKERALEVLNEIHQRLLNLQYLDVKGADYIPPKMKADGIDIVYKMPEK